MAICEQWNDDGCAQTHARKLIVSRLLEVDVDYRLTEGESGLRFNGQSVTEHGPLKLIGEVYTRQLVDYADFDCSSCDRCVRLVNNGVGLVTEIVDQAQSGAISQ